MFVISSTSPLTNNRAVYFKGCIMGFNTWGEIGWAKQYHTKRAAWKAARENGLISRGEDIDVEKIEDKMTVFNKSA